MPPRVRRASVDRRRLESTTVHRFSFLFASLLFRIESISLPPTRRKNSLDTSSSKKVGRIVIRVEEANAIRRYVQFIRKKWRCSYDSNSIIRTISASTNSTNFLRWNKSYFLAAPVEGRSLCNHRRAYKLFTDSVSPKCRFPAFPCPRGYDGLLKGDCFPCNFNGEDRPCGDMGYYSDKLPARGQLYLITRDEEPFCAHQYKVEVYNSRGERPTRSYGKLQVNCFAHFHRTRPIYVSIIIR